MIKAPNFLRAFPDVMGLGHGLISYPLNGFFVGDVIPTSFQRCLDIIVGEGGMTAGPSSASRLGGVWDPCCGRQCV